MINRKPGALFALFLLLLCVTLTLFFSAGEDYYDYASGAVEASAQTSALGKNDLAALSRPAKEPLNTDIKFRNFFLAAPGAKKVMLEADFNGWGKTPVQMRAYGRGYFETSLALPAGEYKYVFVVDGKDVLDPLNQDRTDFNGRAVCIKTIK